MKRIALALTLLLAPAAASAQCNGVFPNNTVCGNVTGSSNTPRATNPSAFLGAAGGSNGQVQYNNGGALGGFTPGGDLTFANPNFTINNNAVTTSKIIDSAVTSAKIADGTITNADLAANAIPILTTRAAAISLDLSAYSSVRTLGYTTAGDGGGAAFKKVAAGTPFLDSYITAATLVGGSSYTNGTYLGVPFTGGTGLGCAGGAVVSGNAVTTVNIVIPCAGYKVGDVLTTPNTFVGGTGSGFTYTVTTVSTAMASFTDSAGNLWQFVPDGWPRTKQFGCKNDWNGTDAGATNDRNCWLSAVAFASVPNSSSSAIINGTTILADKGASLICGNTNGFTLPVPQGVTIRAASNYGGSTIKQCTASNDTDHFVLLCDAYASVGQFGCRIIDMSILADGTSASGTAAVYSLAGQQFPLLENVYIQPGNRGCIFYDYGRGGAANVIFNGVDCESLNTNTNNGVALGSNVGGTQFVFRNFVMGCAPSTCTRNAFNFAGTGANIVVDTVHVEGTTTGFNFGNTGLSSVRNITGGTGCTSLITLQSSNANNTALFENISAGSCTKTITNGHASGTDVTGNIVKQVICGTTCS